MAGYTIKQLEDMGLDKSQIVAKLTGTQDNTGGASQLSISQLSRIGFSDEYIARVKGVTLQQVRFHSQSTVAGVNTSDGLTTRERGLIEQARIQEEAPKTGVGGTGPQQPTPTNPAPGSPVPPPQDLTNDWLSAYDLFGNILKGWGIPMGADIEGVIRNAAIDGITPNQIDLIIPDIQDTNTWRNRFPGWHQRVSNGYNQISVGEYLQLENTYHRILQQAGLPAGFYDTPADFGQWIANDVAPAEITERVNIAMDAVRQVHPTARGLLTEFYGVTSGDLASYFLDQNRALPVLDRQWKAVNVAQWAKRNGLKVLDPAYYESLVDAGITAEEASQGYSTVKTLTDTFGQIGDIYGTAFDQQDAEGDVFFNRSDKRRRLAAMEQATFSGSSRGMSGSADRGTSY